MGKSVKKQNFLQGAAVLAIATALVKVIGALYKIPLNTAIGKLGFSYFSSAYEIYSVLLMISSAGLPVAMSKLISQYSSIGHYNQVRQVYSTSRTIFLILGIASTAFMMLCCKWLANLLNQPNAWPAILCLGPSALFMVIMSTYRGFFQGQGDMRPTSISQVLEAVFKLIVGLAAAFAIIKLTGNVSWAAGGAILGVTVSCLISVFYLRHRIIPAYREMPESGEPTDSFGKTAKQLLSIAIPITIGAAGLSLLTVVETGLYMDRLVYLIGSGQYMPELTAEGLNAQDAAGTLKGVYNMAQTIFNMPCAFIVPITVSVIPAVTSFLTLKEDSGVRSTEESAARVTALLSLPCAVGLFLLGEPVMALLGDCQDQLLSFGGMLMAMLGLCIFPYAIIQYTNALLQAHGYAHVPVINMLVCGVAKLAVVYILVGNPNIGLMGAPIGALVCYFCIAILNLIAIRKLVPQKPRLVRALIRPALAALTMGVAVWCAYKALRLFFSSALILCGGSIVVGVIVYFLCVVLYKAITAEDCKLLPKGDKIAKILHL